MGLFWSEIEKISSICENVKNSFILPNSKKKFNVTCVKLATKVCFEINFRFQLKLYSNFEVGLYVR